MLQIHKLFIYSSLVSVISVLIYHFVLNDGYEFDLLSHAAGGFATAIVCVYVAGLIRNYNLLDSITLLLFAIFAFEFLEYLVFSYILTGVYPNYQQLVRGECYLYDTGSDILFGMIGGLIYTTWWWKIGRNK